MEAFDISGPIAAHSEIDIDADARVVWSVLADLAGWPTWNPAIRHATFDGELEVSGRFRFATDLGTMSCVLRVVDAPRTLAWSGRLLGLGHQHIWRLEAYGGGCRVTTDGAMRGPWARLFGSRLQRRLIGEIDAWARLLKLEAEARSVDQEDEQQE